MFSRRLKFMKKNFKKPFVVIPLIFGVIISFFVFLNTWKQYKLKSELSKAAQISNVSFPPNNLVSYKNKDNYYDDVIQGKTFLIFLSSKCDACKKELGIIADTLPEISKNFKVYGISIEDKEVVSNFVKSSHIEFPVLIDSGAEIFRKLELRYFPTKMVIENGIITKTWVGSSPDKETLMKEIGVGGIQ